MPSLLTYAQAGLRAVDPEQAVHRALTCDRHQLHFAGHNFTAQSGAISVLCMGKAAVPMAQALIDMLSHPPRRGLIVCPHGQGRPVPGCEVIEAGHPVGDAASHEAGQRALELAAECDRNELLLVGISGGASALLMSPPPEISLEESQVFAQQLLASGADIGTVNAIRRRLSRPAGGGLARAAAPAQVWGLLISDVPNDNPTLIASGPLSGDPSHQRTAAELTAGTGITLPPAIQAIVDPPRSLPPNAPELQRVAQAVIAGNALALEAIAAALAPLPVHREAPLGGEAAAAGEQFAQALLRCSGPQALLSGGETTVTLGPHHGRGGRNQEFALAAAKVIAGKPKVQILALGSDGIDGPTDAAGALVDGQTWPRLVATLGPEEAERALRQHDAYPALAAVNALIITGPSGTNVADLAIGLRH